MRSKGTLFVVVVLVLSLPARGESTEPVSTPDVPILLVDMDAMAGEVLLSWTSTTSPYSVVRNTEPNFFGDTPPQIVSFGVGGTTFSDPVLTDGMDYFYSIEDANTLTQVYSANVDGGFSGDEITLTGVGFASVLADNEVFVAGEQAVVTAVTDTTLTFVVPTQTVTGSVVVSTPAGGASTGTPFYRVVTDGLPQISSLAVDGNDVPFVATTGPTGPLSDRVFTFDPMTGARAEVGLLGEATGLPVDNANGVLYGNATVNPLSQGRIERTTAAGGMALYRQCGSGSTCYVFGMGVDPDLFDFGGDGRLYVADGFNQVVKLVPPTGLILTFASGFTFGSSPRGVVPVRDSGSSFYHDVFIGDATSVWQFDSATVPGSLVKTYDSTNSPVMSPRQMDLTPLPRERLLIADEAQDRIVMINPTTDASKVIDIPLVDPKGIAVDVDTAGVAFAYVAEQTRVVKIPVKKTVFIAVWVANGLGSSVGPIRVGNQLRRANSTLDRCGIEVQLRDNEINFFDAGALFDLEVNDFGSGVGQVTCVTPGLMRTTEEATLLDNLRSSESTDLNIYFVNSFTKSGGGTPDYIAEAVTGDCFPDVAGMDDTRSGIIVSVDKLNQWSAETIRTVVHEIFHALMDRGTWTPSTSEHAEASGAALAVTNIMSVPSSRGRWATNNDQCLNINADATIFRGDP